MDAHYPVELPSPIPGGFIYLPRYLRCILGQFAPQIREVYYWLLEQANHQDQVSSGRIIKRGQCVRSYEDIIEGLAWFQGWRKCRYSRHDIETAVKRLKKTGLITIRKTTRGMIITVVNYDYYQNPKNYENHKDNHKENHSMFPTITTDSPHYKQGINEENEKMKKGGVASLPPSEVGESVTPLDIPSEDCWIPECPGPWEEKQSRLPLPWREFVRYLTDTGREPEAGMISALDNIEEAENGHVAFTVKDSIFKLIEEYRRDFEELASQFFNKPIMIAFKIKQEEKGDTRGRLYRDSSSTHC